MNKVDIFQKYLKRWALYLVALTVVCSILGMSILYNELGSADAIVNNKDLAVAITLRSGGIASFIWTIALSIKLSYVVIKNLLYLLFANLKKTQ